VILFVLDNQSIEEQRVTLYPFQIIYTYAYRFRREFMMTGVSDVFFMKEATVLSVSHVMVSE
jgi:hypothetical protein